jgi:hypothetical protein
MEEKLHAGVCGLYCGLCPRFQSTAASRCLGCQLGPQHDYCGVYRCASRQGHFTCADCEQYACERLVRVVGEGVDSFVSHRPMLSNLDRIREVGLEAYLGEQHERRMLVEHLIDEYNEGRSMSFYCTACALMPPEAIRQSIQKTEEMSLGRKVDASDMKVRAKAIKAIIKERAGREGVDLKLRRK